MAFDITNEQLVAWAREATAAVNKAAEVSYAGKPAICVKVHTRPILTKKQEAWLSSSANLHHYSNEEQVRQDLVENFWDWAHERANDLGLKGIYAEGRSGGWLVLNTGKFSSGPHPIEDYVNDLERLTQGLPTLTGSLSLEDPLPVARELVLDTLYSDGAQDSLGEAQDWNQFCEDVREYLATIPQKALERIICLMADEARL